jgi:tetratricopeptide (TPR) repeat protein
MKPDYASAYYNKAACYALQRQVELALENLQRAVEINPSYKDEASTDIDFDEIASDKRFRQFVAGVKITDNRKLDASIQKTSKAIK